jgi:hypothetical protein
MDTVLHPSLLVEKLVNSRDMNISFQLALEFD